MELFITGDANGETGVAEIVVDLSGPTEARFVGKQYGGGLLRFVVVLMCRDPSIAFHRRLRFVRKDKSIYMDIMLDYNWMVQADPIRRRSAVTERLAKEIAETLAKYNISDFDGPRFIKDLEAWIAEAMQLPYRQLPLGPASIGEYEKQMGHLPPGNKIRR
jgi:hypothetical protein